MPLTKKEQKDFEEIFAKCSDAIDDRTFLNNLGDAIFEMTGNVNLRMAIYKVSRKIRK